NTSSDLTTTSNAFTISSNNPNASANQWLDCNDFGAILNETNASFTSTQNESYAIQLTENSCLTH
ncbi:MAG: hypothetical protein JKY48_10230, partial [Flavobacteriales bacterium]|nr:hypothetical protein [Flavobacteriales bacterium]